ncbi:polyprenyl synthetase family protein [Rhodopila sp.]|uniref:polyprenyl synthetase family protein n=1 Tax=Rhodopila sp. TaxID=2480087 RepID=UPI003D1233DE
MDAITRIERTLSASIDRVDTADAPPLLAAAMRHAVFPRGARIRPRLCLAVAAACGDDQPGASDAAAAAIELMHCASLIHDDLPCFDNADTRRGRPSVHRAFNEPLAVLAGDALIVLSFQAIAWGATDAPARLPALLLIMAGATGLPSGIAAGQAWECEPSVDLARYQRAKTGALFAAATALGAAAAGAEPQPWRELGERLGEAYQVADDIADVLSGEADLGKPIGQDLALGRPNAALTMGVDGALRHLEALAEAAADSIPPCPGASALKALTLSEARRLLPKDLSQRAA